MPTIQARCPFCGAYVDVSFSKEKPTTDYLLINTQCPRCHMPFTVHVKVREPERERQVGLGTAEAEKKLFGKVF